MWARCSSDLLQLRASPEAGKQPSSGVPGLLDPTVVSHSTSHCGSLGEPHGHLAALHYLSSPPNEAVTAQTARGPPALGRSLLHPPVLFSPQHLSTGDVKSACGSGPHWQNPVPGGPGLSAALTHHSGAWEAGLLGVHLVCSRVDRFYEGCYT